MRIAKRRASRGKSDEQRGSAWGAAPLELAMDQAFRCPKAHADGAIEGQPGQRHGWLRRSKRPIFLLIGAGALTRRSAEQEE
jgi:hypothetical protein